MGIKVNRGDVSSALKRTSGLHRSIGDWFPSHDIPSDVTVIVDGIAYSLHKLPLVSRCGWIQRLVREAKEPDLSTIELCDFPGGAETFEFVAKLCYGINFEIDVRNVASLRCVGEYLDMSEAYGQENLCARTDAFINDIVLKNLHNCVMVLKECEYLLPLADQVGIVGKCVNAVATKVCCEQMTPSLSRSDLSSSGEMGSLSSPRFSISTQTSVRKSVEWWVEEISVLRIDSFERVLTSMKAHGLHSDNLAIAITHYAHRWLKGSLRKPVLGNQSRLKSKLNDTIGHQQRILLETLVSLIPREKNLMPVSFLCAMLQLAIYLDTTIACRLDLEKKIGWQLEQATVDDILIPSHSLQSGDTFFDLETVARIVMNFLQKEAREEEQDILAHYDYESTGISHSASAIIKAARLFDSYLAEVAPDANLSADKFVTFAGLMPACSRVVDDGLYRAIDVYLKAHPGVDDQERKKICSLMDCQKLSQEACVHAAQNERLPAQVVVQVLFFEQMRLRNAMSGSGKNKADHREDELPQRAQGLTSLDHVAMVQRENQELKMELTRMKLTLAESDQKQHPHKNAEGNLKETNEKPKNRFSKILSKLNPFRRASANDSLRTSLMPDIRVRKQRRHSIS